MGWQGNSVEEVQGSKHRDTHHAARPQSGSATFHFQIFLEPEWAPIRRVTWNCVLHHRFASTTQPRPLGQPASQSLHNHSTPSRVCEMGWRLCPHIRCASVEITARGKSGHPPHLHRLGWQSLARAPGPRTHSSHL